MVTSVIVAASGGDYTSLNAANAAEAKDLTGLGNFTIFCEGFQDTLDVALTSWTTTASDRLIIRNAIGHHHNGVTRAAGGTGYQLHSLTLTIPLRYAQANTDFIGIEMSHNDGTAFQTYAGVGTGSIDQCLIHNDVTTVSTNYVMNTKVAGTDILITNSIIFGKSRGIEARGGITTLENCVVYTEGASHGVLGNSSTVVKNTLSSGYGTCYFSPFSGGSNNASSDSTATANFTSSINSIAASSVYTTPSTDPALADWSPLASNPLIDNGVTLTKATDVSGTARTGTWDIGAWEYVVVSTGITGSGAVTLGGITLTGSGLRTLTASGAIALSNITITGTALRSIIASGNTNLSKIVIGGVGVRAIQGSSAALLSNIIIAGTGLRGTVGTGTVALPTILVSGTSIAVIARAETQLNDLWMGYLLDRGHTGSLNDKLLKAYQVQTGSSKKDINDLMQLYFTQQGFVDETLNDKFLSFLKSNYSSFDGSVQDRLREALKTNKFFI